MNKKELKLIKNGNYYIGQTFEDDKRLAYRLSEQPDDVLIPKHPELVDIKLTDVCHIGCAFCYQNSLAKGKHGDLDTIKTVIKSLDPEITEVAYGGGDVLQHPDIVEILEYSREHGLHSSNITMNWQSVVRYPNKVEKVMPLLDAIGVSITGDGQVKQVVDQLEELNYFRPSRICYHIIPDLYSSDKIITILDEIKKHSIESDVLFLGFKKNGRGKNAKPKHVDSMDKIFKHIIQEKINLQCDTKFIVDYMDIVEKFSSKLTYDIKEGEYSMNIDCVEKFYSVSSYNLNFKEHIDENFDIVEAFKKVRQQGNLPTT